MEMKAQKCSNLKKQYGLYLSYQTIPKSAPNRILKPREFFADH